MTYKIKDCLIAKEGIIDESTNTDLSGWQGRVIKEADESGLLELEWDSITLKAMPKSYIIKSEEGGYDYCNYNIFETDILPTSSRDNQKDVKKMQDKLEDEYYWIGMGKDGKRIQAVLDTGDEDHDELMIWEEYLEEHLKMSFEVEYTGDQGYNYREKPLILKAIVDSDDHYGLIAALKEARQVPLCDLEPVATNKNTQLLIDYCVWFANKRN
jgi:hypothetical protein